MRHLAVVATPARPSRRLARRLASRPPTTRISITRRSRLYLGQLQGGIADSEQLTQQLARSGTAGVSAGGVSLGGSVGSTATAERVVTPTATARFYQLLDLLGQDRFLHTIDMAAGAEQIAHDFAAVPEGSFVQLQHCAVELPAYAGLLQAARSPGFDFSDPYGLSGSSTNAANEPAAALVQAEYKAGLLHSRPMDNCDSSTRPAGPGHADQPRAALTGQNSRPESARCRLRVAPAIRTSSNPAG